MKLPSENMGVWEKYLSFITQNMLWDQAWALETTTLISKTRWRGCAEMQHAETSAHDFEWASIKRAPDVAASRPI